MAGRPAVVLRAYQGYLHGAESTIRHHPAGRAGIPRYQRAAGARPFVLSAHWRGRSLSGVLWDLDGTLLDTAADITLALNRAVSEFGWTPLAQSDVRRMIGRGAPILVERAALAQQRTLDEAHRASVVARFFHHYGELEQKNESTALPYSGAMAVLQQLDQAGLRSAVVTNKQRRFAVELLQRLGLNRWIHAVVGGDSCERRSSLANRWGCSRSRCSWSEIRSTMCRRRARRTSP